MTQGYKTTEFWLGLVTVLLTYLNGALKWNVPVQEVVTALGLVLAYVGARTWLKNTQLTKTQ